MEIIFELSLLKLGESSSPPFVAHVPHLAAASAPPIRRLLRRRRRLPSSTSPKIDSRDIRKAKDGKTETEGGREGESLFSFAEFILFIRANCRLTDGRVFAQRRWAGGWIGAQEEVLLHLEAEL